MLEGAKMQAEESRLGVTLAAEEHGHRNTELGQAAREENKRLFF